MTIPRQQCHLALEFLQYGRGREVVYGMGNGKFWQCVDEPGAPKRGVTALRGIKPPSAGNVQRALQSRAMVEPISIVSGSTWRWLSVPIKRRTMWGVARPMKAMYYDQDQSSITTERSRHRRHCLVIIHYNATSLQTKNKLYSASQAPNTNKDYRKLTIWENLS